ncbi:DUF3288 family protein [Gloeobacter kilaueensis]|uniref:DUF3288 domain-containing protein n=1 Tax=Gloeobacter kilaueensis (strain ATCC BAA-2537 / CCAP 1431/1 / ULC 316 / JS1) TaxID=1183438 RepID=U5QP63_GLOK1|nr:DUF3288 family protein [Gloeobacter kilaueensis]AGY60736.1 hypothetical protein GKIL_4490 [Gloeobacter kilaueensis JS1]
MNQTHPQYHRDRQTISQLLREEASDYNLAELARLIIRYRGFPGAADLQNDLKALLTNWQLTEEALFERTRHIHISRPVYGSSDASQEDWL